MAYHDIIDFLTPYMDPDYRQMYVREAFQDEPIVDSLDYSGANRVFTERLIYTLEDYDGNTAIMRLLRVMKGHVGPGKQQTIDSLIARLESTAGDGVEADIITSSGTKIFLAYSRRDQLFAARLARLLSEIGADVWLDVEDIPAGLKWHRAIEQGLRMCNVLILVITPAAMDSDNVEAEWFYFHDEGKPIIPVLKKFTKIHHLLRPLHYIDFEKQAYEAAFRQLHSELLQKGFDVTPLPLVQPGGNTSSVKRQVDARCKST